MVDIERIATDVVDCAIKVHKAVDPGLLESAYPFCHTYELRKRGWYAETEVKLPLIYEDQKIDVGYRIDTLVNEDETWNKTVCTQLAGGESLSQKVFPPLK